MWVAEKLCFQYEVESMHCFACVKDTPWLKVSGLFKHVPGAAFLSTPLAVPENGGLQGMLFLSSGVHTCSVLLTLMRLHTRPLSQYVTSMSLVRG